MLWASAASGAEEMAALPGLVSETPASVALRAALQLGKLLAVLGALSPTSAAAGLMAGSTVPLGLGEIVGVEILGRRPADDLLPLYGLDVAEVVVVDDADAALENVCGKKE